MSEWVWTDPDCEERCKLENFECGDSKWLGKLFKGSTIELSENNNDENDDGAPEMEHDGPAIIEDKSDGTFFEQLRVPLPPKTGPKKSAAARAKLLSVGPPCKRPRAEVYEEATSILAFEDEHQVGAPCPLESPRAEPETPKKKTQGRKSNMMALHSKEQPMEVLVG